MSFLSFFCLYLKQNRKLTEHSHTKGSHYEEYKFICNKRMRNTFKAQDTLSVLCDLEYSL